MTQKRNIKHPIFVLGLISYFLLLLGIILLSSNHELGRLLILTSFLTGGIHWIGSLITVVKDTELKGSQSHYFWFANVLMVPPIAGMIYYMVDEKTFFQ